MKHLLFYPLFLENALQDSSLFTSSAALLNQGPREVHEFSSRMQALGENIFNRVGFPWGFPTGL